MLERPPGRWSDSIWTSGGDRVVSKERTSGIDLQTLPRNPSPPDMWQDKAACHGLDPDVFFPTSEEEAGPALAYC